MRKTDYFVFILFLTGAIAGWFIHGYAGGITTGSCLMLLLLFTIGKKSAAVATRRINKSIKDIITEQE